nr:MAG TPA: hypothetical protein [Caudoviricetes sp.]
MRKIDNYLLKPSKIILNFILIILKLYSRLLLLI